MAVNIQCVQTGGRRALSLFGSWSQLAYALLFRRQIESGTVNPWGYRLFFGRSLTPTAGDPSYSERSSLRLAAERHDERVRAATEHLERLQKKYGPDAPEVLAAQTELEAALAYASTIDADWVAWDAKRHGSQGSG